MSNINEKMGSHTCLLPSGQCRRYYISYSPKSRVEKISSCGRRARRMDLLSAVGIIRVHSTLGSVLKLIENVQSQNLNCITNASIRFLTSQTLGFACS